MQTSKIKIGEKYAFRYLGEEVPLYVTDMVTRKTSDKSKTTLDGWVQIGDERSMVHNIDVADIIDEFSKRQHLVEENARREARIKAEREAKEAKQWLVVQALAKAIGAQAVKDRYGSFRDRTKTWDQNEAAIIVDSSAIEINEPAFDALLEFLARR